MPLQKFPHVIKNLALFVGIPERERNELLKAATLKNYPRGSTLFKMGDPIIHFYIICQGTMQLVRGTPDGKEITTDLVIAGSSIGKKEILGSSYSRHLVTALAVEDTTVLEFPASWLQDVAKHPVVFMNILTHLSKYMHMMEIESEHKSTMSAPQQLACFLQRLCIMHNLDHKAFTLPYNKALIASRMGMTPETFSRTLSKLKENGLHVNNNKVMITDHKRLDDYVCSRCSSAEECPTQKSIQKKFLKSPA